MAKQVEKFILDLDITGLEALTGLTKQLRKIGFYSNYIVNDLQEKLSKKIIEVSRIKNYKIF